MVDNTVLVKFLSGAGTSEMLPVLYVAQYPRGPNGCCAFCNGDPCNEEGTTDTPIARFYAAAPHADTCPICDGRPS